MHDFLSQMEMVVYCWGKLRERDLEFFLQGEERVSYQQKRTLPEIFRAVLLFYSSSKEIFALTA